MQLVGRDMSLVLEPVIDVANVMASLRDEVARRHADTPGWQDASHATARTSNAAHWNQIYGSLNLAEQRAPVGSAVPPMVRFRGVKRIAARVVAKITLYLLQIVTIHQREFNFASIRSIRLLGKCLRDTEAALAAQQAKAGQLEKRLARRESQLEALQARMTQVQSTLDRLGNSLAAPSSEMRNSSPSTEGQNLA